MSWTNKLISISILSVLAVKVWATSASLPERQEVYSTDLVYKFEVWPPEKLTIRDAMDMHIGDYVALTGRNPDRPPAFFHPVGKLYAKLKGNYVLIWQRVLENAVSPGRVLLAPTKTGVRVITLNDFFLFRDSTDSVVIYDEGGKTVARLPLSRLVSERELDAAYSQSDSIDLLQNVSVHGDTLEIRLRSNSVAISLTDGSIRKSMSEAKPRTEANVPSPGN